MRARDLMTSPAITCHVNDTLTVAAQRMWDHDIGAIAVVNDEGRLTGIITDRDICMAAYTNGRALEDLLVNGAMSRHACSARPEQSIADIEKIMAEHQIRRVPIVDANHMPIGVVSLNDLARESVQPDSAIKQGLAKLAHTLAAICAPRTHGRSAA